MKKKPFYSDPDSTGYDMSNYTKELESFRNNRVISLRRSISLNLSTKSVHIPGFHETPKRSHAFVPRKKPCFNPDSFIGIIAGRNSEQICDLFLSLIGVTGNDLKQLNSLFSNYEVILALVSVFINDYSAKVIEAALQCIADVFPHIGNSKDILIDEGVGMELMNILEGDSIELLNAGILVICSVSQYSGYGRDYMICLGYHTILMRIAEIQNGTELSDYACEAIHMMFHHPDPVETSIIKESVPLLHSLLPNASKIATASILGTMVEMSNKLPSIVFTYHELGLYKEMVNYIQEPELVGIVLRLVGNMAVSQPTQIKSLLDSGILVHLFQLMPTEYQPDVFWILSNLLESLPKTMLAIFDEQFITSVLLLSQESGYEGKKEIAYFLSTITLFNGNSSISFFFNTDFVSIFCEVLGCGFESITLRCLEAIMLFCSHVISSNDQELASILLDSDLEDRLNDLFSEESMVLSERAQYILNQLKEVQKRLR